MIFLFLALVAILFGTVELFGQLKKSVLGATFVVILKKKWGNWFRSRWHLNKMFMDKHDAKQTKTDHKNKKAKIRNQYNQVLHLTQA